jgi:hypothetical protein
MHQEQAMTLAARRIPNTPETWNLFRDGRGRHYEQRLEK